MTLKDMNIEVTGGSLWPWLARAQAIVSSLRCHLPICSDSQKVRVSQASAIFLSYRLDQNIGDQHRRHFALV